MLTLSGNKNKNKTNLAAAEVLFFDGGHNYDEIGRELEDTFEITVVRELPTIAQLPVDTVVVAGLGDNGLEELDALRSIYTRLDVIITKKVCPDLSRALIKIGVGELFVEPLVVSEVIESVRLLKLERQNSNLRDKETHTQVSAFMSVKGGAGASFIATNIAQMLVAQSNYSTVLVDLDLQTPSAAGYLDMQPKNSLISALNVGQDLDSIGVQGFLTRHDSGLKLLSGANTGTTDMVLLEELRAEGVEPILALARDGFRRVIVDIPGYLNLTTVTALQHVDHVFLVMEQQLSHMNNIIRLVKVLREELYIEDPCIHIVVNRYDKNAAITLLDIRKLTKILNVTVIDNNHKLAQASLNEAQAVFELAPKSALCQQLNQVAEQAGGQVIKQELNLFQKLFKGA